jgi:flagellar L-ring protein FlgH
MNRTMKVALLLAVCAMPAAELTAQADGQRAARQSWTSDRRAYDVGDVITVLVDERTLASATMNQSATERRNRDMRAGASQNVTPVYPSVGAQVGSSNDADSRRRGEASRQNRFVGEMTVRVVGIENGLLQIRGEKRTSVDRNRQDLTLTGWVRPEDVTRNNTVESWRVGDAQIVYRSRGSLGRAGGGIITRIISVFWP